jgi:hypothetical protein
MENGQGRRVSDHVVSTLARVIADAKAGSVDAVAIVAVGPDGQPRVHFGGAGDLVPSINLGLDMIKATFMQQALGAPGAAEMNSGLIVPGTH